MTFVAICSARFSTFFEFVWIFKIIFKSHGLHSSSKRSESKCLGKSHSESPEVFTNLNIRAPTEYTVFVPSIPTLPGDLLVGAPQIGAAERPLARMPPRPDLFQAYQIMFHFFIHSFFFIFFLIFFFGRPHNLPTPFPPTRSLPALALKQLPGIHLTIISSLASI